MLLTGRRNLLFYAFYERSFDKTTFINTPSFLFPIKVKGSKSFNSFDTPISYFTNPSYPERDSVPNYNAFTVKVSTYFTNYYL